MHGGAEAAQPPALGGGREVGLGNRALQQVVQVLRHLVKGVRCNGRKRRKLQPPAAHLAPRGQSSPAVPPRGDRAWLAARSDSRQDGQTDGQTVVALPGEVPSVPAQSAEGAPAQPGRAPAREQDREGFATIICDWKSPVISNEELQEGSWLSFINCHLLRGSLPCLHFGCSLPTAWRRGSEATSLLPRT